MTDTLTVLIPLSPSGRLALRNTANIIEIVAAKFNLRIDQLKMRSNRRTIAYPRQIAMYLSRELTNRSLPEIGELFGGKHHTTVLHAVRKIARLRESDPELNALLEQLIAQLSAQ